MFGFGRKKKIVVRRYRGITPGGARKKFEKDANKLAKQGYRPTNTTNSSRSWFGTSTSGEFIVTYELVG